MPFSNAQPGSALFRRLGNIGRAVLKELDPRDSIARRRQIRRNQRNRDALFIWVPKTAGTSLFSAFEHFGAQKILSLSSLSTRFTGRGVYSFGHMSIPDLVDEGYISQGFLDRAWKFAFVRNPYDRAVSLFRYLVRTEVLPPKTTFPVFCSFLKERAFEDIGLYNRKGLNQLSPQARWIFDRSGNCLCDYVGRFETIYDSFAAVQETLGFHEPATKLPHKNATERRTVEHYYTDREVEIVASIYAEDFQRFGYDLSLTARTEQTDESVKVNL